MRACQRRRVPHPLSPEPGSIKSHPAQLLRDSARFVSLHVIGCQWSCDSRYSPGFRSGGGAFVTPPAAE